MIKVAPDGLNPLGRKYQRRNQCFLQGVDMSELSKLSRSEVRVGRPLAWPVFDSEGQLLLKQGHIVESQAQLERLLDRGYHPPISEGGRNTASDLAHTEKTQPLIEWPLLLGRLEKALDSVAKRNATQQRLRDLGERLEHLCQADADASLALIHLYSGDANALEQNLFCALLCALMGRHLALEPARINTLIAAALTAKLALLPYQDKLNSLKAALTPEQRAIVDKHPALSVEALQAADIHDPLWSQIILQSHELGEPGTVPEARILAVCETYTALISHRGYRERALPGAALLALQQADQSPAQSQAVDALGELLGPFPPGCFVQLVNQEIALVTHQGKQRDQPRVQSLVAASGKAFFGSFTRDTHLDEYRPVQQVPPVSLTAINLPALWD